ncbi:GNAT family N-acetyltransferase [Luteococcus sp. OSA5]|uniref:GNAT family N-acetyltransferase n=1 Tax=Luteococcus sp. OSA5 TaxID=3401630 RepID=UPI003B42EE43
MSAGRGLQVELAGPDDAADLAAIYASDDGFPGRIAVSFRRGSNPLASLGQEGDRVVVPLVREAASGSPVGMGACVIRPSVVAGRMVTVGYLTGLKVVPRFRRSPLALAAMPAMYGFLQRQVPEVELFTTTILDENRAAITLLEKGHRGMPEYRRVGHVTTCALHRHWRPPELRQDRLRLVRGSLEELLAAREHDGLADLALLTAPPALGGQDAWLLRDRRGGALAGCAVWDQRHHKQHVVTSYSSAMSLARRLPMHLVDLPRMPRPGAVADEAAICLPWARGGDPGLLSTLLRGVGWRESHRDYLLVAALDDSPLGRALQAERAIRYGSRLYTVHFPDSPQHTLRPMTTDVEVGLL